MEAPVAAALGRLDGLNLFDPFWMDPEYDIWYRLLNCGHAAARLDRLGLVRLLEQPRLRRGRRRRSRTTPGSTACAPAGRFITDGPMLRLRWTAQAPGNDVAGRWTRRRGPPPVEVEWAGAQPLDRIEIIRDGEVAPATTCPSGRAAGVLRGARRRRPAPAGSPRAAGGGRAPATATRSGRTRARSTCARRRRRRPPAAAASVRRGDRRERATGSATRARFDDDRPARPDARSCSPTAAVSTSGSLDYLRAESAECSVLGAQQRRNSATEH